MRNAFMKALKRHFPIGIRLRPLVEKEISQRDKPYDAHAEALKRIIAADERKNDGRAEYC